MEKKFDIIKVDGYFRGRNNCQLDIECRMNFDNQGRMTFAASANVWNSRHTDILMGGQCFDTVVREFPAVMKNPIFREVYDLWQKHHLNDLHAGTVKQEAILNKWWNRGHRSDYNTDKRVLNLLGYLEDIYEGKPYKYGTAWLYREIPADDQKRIKALFQ